MEPQRTTIQVHRDLLDQLDLLKRELGARSYEDVIRALLRERRRLPRSYFGTAKGAKPFRREELDRLG